jgi:hypothetical protein
MSNPNLSSNHLDLAVAWDWEFDNSFIQLLRTRAATKGLRFNDITVYDLPEILKGLRDKSLTVGCFLDRASDTNELFLPLQDWIQQSGSRSINPYFDSQRTINKAQIHYDLMQSGVHVPFTVMLPSYDQSQFIGDTLMREVEKIPIPFVLKPAHGGGGEGVIKNVTQYFHVHDGRKAFHWDPYLAQELICPKYLYGWRCWFRAYFIFGDIDIVWWDDLTHIYRTVSAEDKVRVGFTAMEAVMKKIASVAKLHFFSSELALPMNNQLVAVDYINDQIDLRLKSEHYDGVPNIIVEKIIEKILVFAETCRHEHENKITFTPS